LEKTREHLTNALLQRPKSVFVVFVVSVVFFSTLKFELSLYFTMDY